MKAYMKKKKRGKKKCMLTCSKLDGSGKAFIEEPLSRSDIKSIAKKKKKVTTQSATKTAF